MDFLSTQINFFFEYFPGLRAFNNKEWLISVIENIRNHYPDAIHNVALASPLYTASTSFNPILNALISPLFLNELNNNGSYTSNDGTAYYKNPTEVNNNNTQLGMEERSVNNDTNPDNGSISNINAVIFLECFLFVCYKDMENHLQQLLVNTTTQQFIFRNQNFVADKVILDVCKEQFYNLLLSVRLQLSNFKCASIVYKIGNINGVVCLARAAGSNINLDPEQIYAIVTAIQQADSGNDQASVAVENEDCLTNQENNIPYNNNDNEASISNVQNLNSDAGANNGDIIAIEQTNSENEQKLNQVIYENEACSISPGNHISCNNNDNNASTANVLNLSSPSSIFSDAYGSSNSIEYNRIQHSRVVADAKPYNLFAPTTTSGENLNSSLNNGNINAPATFIPNSQSNTRDDAYFSDLSSVVDGYGVNNNYILNCVSNRSHIPFPTQPIPQYPMHYLHVTNIPNNANSLVPNACFTRSLDDLNNNIQSSNTNFGINGFSNSSSNSFAGVRCNPSTNSFIGALNTHNNVFGTEVGNYEFPTYIQSTEECQHSPHSIGNDFSKIAQNSNAKMNVGLVHGMDFDFYSPTASPYQSRLHTSNTNPNSSLNPTSNIHSGRVFPNQERNVFVERNPSLTLQNQGEVTMDGNNQFYDNGMGTYNANITTLNDVSAIDCYNQIYNQLVNENAIRTEASSSLDAFRAHMAYAAGIKDILSQHANLHRNSNSGHPPFN